MLVLVYNSQVEKELDRKSKPCYLGPFEVVHHTQGGSYILKEMDGTISTWGIAAFWPIPYYSWHTPLPASILPDDDESDDENNDENDNEWNAYDSDDLSWWKDDGKDVERCWEKMLKELLEMLMTYDKEDGNENDENEYNSNNSSWSLCSMPHATSMPYAAMISMLPLATSMPPSPSFQLFLLPCPSLFTIRDDCIFCCLWMSCTKHVWYSGHGMYCWFEIILEWAMSVTHVAVILHTRTGPAYEEESMKTDYPDARNEYGML